jgi:hypothetical protein
MCFLPATVLKGPGEEGHYQWMTDPAVPPDFVSYVERRLPVIEAATLRLTGQEGQSERLARDLLTLVAMRWDRLRRTDVKHGLTPPASADAYLTGLFQQEASELGYPQAKVNFDLPVASRRRPGLLERMSAADEAELLWRGARGTIRRRLIIGAGVVGLLGVLAMCQNADDDTDGDSDGRVSPAPQRIAPVGLPDGADLVPPTFELSARLPGLPESIVWPGRDVPLLSSSPIGRAVALLASSRADASPIYVLGSDGGWRVVDHAPQFAALWLHPGVLAPGGTRAAFGTNSGTVLVDLTTGAEQQLPAVRPSMRPVWLTDQHLLLGPDKLVDVGSGELIRVPVPPDDVLVPQHAMARDPLSRLTQLLPAGSPVTAPARVQRWQGSPPVPVSTAINGPLSLLVGVWQGNGFVNGAGLAVRVCSPARLPGSPAITSVVAVLRQDTGRVVRALVVDAESSGDVRLLGWAGEQHVLLSLSMLRDQKVFSWDVGDGQLTLVSTVNSGGMLSLPDLTWAA